MNVTKDALCSDNYSQIVVSFIGPVLWNGYSFREWRSYSKVATTHFPFSNKNKMCNENVNLNPIRKIYFRWEANHIYSHSEWYCKDVPIFISASAISAYRHFFSISAYRLSANIFSADIADIWISAFGDISAKYQLEYCLGYGKKMVINKQFPHFLTSIKGTMLNYAQYKKIYYWSTFLSKITLSFDYVLEMFQSSTCEFVCILPTSIQNYFRVVPPKQKPVTINTFMIKPFLITFCTF